MILELIFLFLVLACVIFLAFSRGKGNGTGENYGDTSYELLGEIGEVDEWNTKNCNKPLEYVEKNKLLQYAQQQQEVGHKFRRFFGGRR